MNKNKLKLIFKLISSGLLCLYGFILFFAEWSLFYLLIASVFINKFVNDFEAYQNNKILPYSVKYYIFFALLWFVMLLVWIIAKLKVS